MNCTCESPINDCPEHGTGCDGRRYMALKADRDELAHALYTVLLHAQNGALVLLEDRVRGAAEAVPMLAERYPEIKALLNA